MFFIALAILIVFHALAGFAAYKIFTVRRHIPPAPVETTTPEERASGRSSVRGTMEYWVKFTPLPVTLYIVGGFVGLGAAAIIGAFAYLRGG